MKKLLTVLLGLVVATGIFAQATVNGYVRSIQTVNTTGDAYSDRLRLNLSYTSDDKTVYFFSRLQVSAYGASTTYKLADNTLYPADSDTTYDSITIANTDLAVSYLYGQLTLANGMFKVAGGKLGNWDYRFSTGYSNYYLGNVASDYDYIDGVKGFQVEAFPVKGLAVIGTVVPDSTSAVALDADNFYVAGKYAIDGVGTAVFDFKPYANGTMKAGGHFKYTGIAGLGVAAGFKYNTTSVGNAVFSIVDYASGPLSVQVAPQYFLTTGLYVEGAASYKINDNFKVQAIGAYDGTSALQVISSQYLAGLEAFYNLGKGQIEGDFYYSAKDSWSVKLTEKVSF